MAPGPVRPWGPGIVVLWAVVAVGLFVWPSVLRPIGIAPGWVALGLGITGISINALPGHRYRSGASKTPPRAPTQQPFAGRLVIPATADLLLGATLCTGWYVASLDVGGIASAWAWFTAPFMLGLVVALARARYIVQRVGPRNILRPVMALAALSILVLALVPALRLGVGPLLVAAILLGASIGLGTIALGAWSGQPRVPGFSLLGAATLLGLGLAGSWLMLAFALVGAALVLVLPRIDDPVRSDDPVRHILPWNDPAPTDALTPPPRPVVPSLRRFAPFSLLYLAATWALFIPNAHHTGSAWVLPRVLLERFAYQIPELASTPGPALLRLATAPFVNNDHIQLVYVTVLFLLLVVPFERHEGSLRTTTLFLATTAIGAITASIALINIYPDLSDHDVFRVAWERSWSGGSVGAFGIMGALAARARNPWPLLAFFAFWELNVGWWYLKSYTPAFHGTALVVGFGAVRFLSTARPIAARTSS